MTSSNIRKRFCTWNFVINTKLGPKILLDNTINYKNLKYSFKNWAADSAQFSTSMTVLWTQQKNLFKYPFSGNLNLWNYNFPAIYTRIISTGKTFNSEGFANGVPFIKSSLTFIILQYWDGFSSRVTLHVERPQTFIPSYPERAPLWKLYFYKKDTAKIRTTEVIH